MTILEMLGQSGILTVLGMGVVFSFLIIMVFCVSAMGKIVQALGAGKDEEGPQAAAASVQAGNTKAVTAAIVAAINEYRAVSNSLDNS